MTRWMPLPLSRPWKKRVRRRILSPPKRTCQMPMTLALIWLPRQTRAWRMIRLPQMPKTHLVVLRKWKRRMTSLLRKPRATF